LAERTKIAQKPLSAFLAQYPNTRIKGSSSPLTTSNIKGIVFSGKGEGAKYIKLPWVTRQIKEELGFTPYIGTLNIRLAEADANKLKEALKKANPTEISPSEGFCRGKCFKAFLMGNVECAVVVPEIAKYPENVVEIVAPTNLRERLHAKDGDTVEVTILF
jgi:CTP-dependent riboflavin kinase